jgi:hypothetical protein
MLSLPGEAWGALRAFPGLAGGLHFPSADLGLFVFQYGLDLLDLRNWQAPGMPDLWAAAQLATEANRRVCAAAREKFVTYRRHWGLSAGDGPGHPPHRDNYRAYAPGVPLDGTAHLTASLAAVAHAPHAVLENLRAAEHARGRYGFSNVNLDHDWIGEDMVGIDAGAAVLALDNYLADDRVRAGFHRLPCVARALERPQFARRDEPARLAS